MKYLFSIFIFLTIQQSAYCQLKDSSFIGKDTECMCKPSLPLEIISTSIVWGLPSYWLWRPLFDHDSSNYLNILFMPESLFLLMFTLGPMAEWTSGCEASYWHTLWIGLGTSFAAVIAYGIYGFDHDVKPHNKFNFPEYLAIGFVPSVASCFIYNLFLHCPEKKNQSMYLIPSFGGKNTASINFMMQF